MKLFTIIIGAGETQQLDVVGNYYRAMTASAAFSIATDNGDLQAIAQGIGEYLDEGFTRLHLYSATAQTIVLAVARGRVDDARLSISAPIDIGSIVPVTVGTIVAPTTLYNMAPVTLLGGTNTLITAANSLRREAIIESSPANTADISVGGTGVIVGGGITLSPGEKYTFETSAAIYARCAVGGQIISGVEVQS